MARSGTQVSKMTNPMMMRARSLSTNDVAALQTVATQERQEHGVSVEDVEMLKDMFNDWDDDTLVLVISSNDDVEACIDAIVLAGSPQQYRKHYRDHQEAAHNGELKGKFVVVTSTGRPELDGVRGLALEWVAEQGGYYVVRMEGAQRNLPLRLRAACVKEWVFPVCEQTVAAAVGTCQFAVLSMVAGDVEGGIGLLKGPTAPPLAWKRHQGVGKETWAAFQMVLGSAYLERIVGKRQSNVEASVSHFLGALDVYSQEAYPLPWAEVNLCLATAYAERRPEDGFPKAESLDLSAHHYAAALEVFEKPKHPVEWAMVQANLATALRERSALLFAENPLPSSSADGKKDEDAKGGDSSSSTEKLNPLQQEAVDCLEAAIVHYECALEVFSQSNSGEVWSVLQNHLAACYADRTVGDKSENMEKSVEHFEAALGIMRQLRASGEAPKSRYNGGQLRPTRDTTPQVAPYDRARDESRPRPTAPPGAFFSRSVSRNALPPNRHQMGYQPTGAPTAQVRERPPAPLSPSRGPLPLPSDPLPSSSSSSSTIPQPPLKSGAPPTRASSNDTAQNKLQPDLFDEPRTVTVQAVVPEGAHAGDVLYVKGPGGGVYALPLPMGAESGQTISFHVTEKTPAPAAAKKGSSSSSSSSWLGLGGTVSKTGVSSASNSEPETVKITVPPDAEPGDEVEVNPPNGGRAFMAKIPPGLKPGMTFYVPVPPELKAMKRQTMSITVPKGANPGSRLEFKTPSGATIRATVPEGYKPGMRLSIPLPAEVAQPLEGTWARPLKKKPKPPAESGANPSSSGDDGSKKSNTNSNSSGGEDNNSSSSRDGGDPATDNADTSEAATESPSKRGKPPKARSPRTLTTRRSAASEASSGGASSGQSSRGGLESFASGDDSDLGARESSVSDLGSGTAAHPQQLDPKGSAPESYNLNDTLGDLDEGDESNEAGNLESESKSPPERELAEEEEEGDMYT